MRLTFKKFAALLVISSLLAVALFSFTIMMHGARGMTGDCPFSAGDNFCPQDVLAIVVHHISATNSFLNVLISLLLVIIPAAFISVLFKKLSWRSLDFNFPVPIFQLAPILPLRL